MNPENGQVAPGLGGGRGKAGLTSQIASPPKFFCDFPQPQLSERRALLRHGTPWARSQALSQLASPAMMNNTVHSTFTSRVPKRRVLGRKAKPRSVDRQEGRLPAK
jgi:hypothetical protein